MPFFSRSTYQFFFSLARKNEALGQAGVCGKESNDLAGNDCGEARLPHSFSIYGKN